MGVKGECAAGRAVIPAGFVGGSRGARSWHRQSAFASEINPRPDPGLPSCVSFHAAAAGVGSCGRVMMSTENLVFQRKKFGAALAFRIEGLVPRFYPNAPRPTGDTPISPPSAAVLRPSAVPRRARRDTRRRSPDYLVACRIMWLTCPYDGRRVSGSTQGDEICKSQLGATVTVKASGTRAGAGRSSSRDCRSIAGTSSDSPPPLPPSPPGASSAGLGGRER